MYNVYAYDVFIRERIRDYENTNRESQLNTYLDGKPVAVGLSNYNN